MNALRLLSVRVCLLGFVLLSACSSSPQAKTEAAKTYVSEGRAAEKRGDHVGAIALYTRAIESDPKYAEAWQARGYSNIQLCRNANAPDAGRDYEDRAISDYSQAIGLDPSRGDAFYGRAMLYASRAQYRQAVEDLLNSVKCNPLDPEPHLDLARIYESKFEDMRMASGEHYVKYAELGGRDPEARETAKRFLEFKKHLEEGKIPTGKPPTEEDERKARELHARMMDLIKEGKKDEAVKLLEELLTVYGRTRFVADPSRLAGLKAMLAAFKKEKEPPK